MLMVAMSSPCHPDRNWLNSASIWCEAASLEYSLGNCDSHGELSIPENTGIVLVTDAWPAGLGRAAVAESKFLYGNDPCYRESLTLLTVLGELAAP